MTRRVAISVAASIFLFLPLALGIAESFTFSADRVESVMAEGKERTVLSGRAKVRSGTLLIRADRIEISGKDFNDLLCTGSVVAIDDERGIRIETPRLAYDRKKKFSHMEGASILEDAKNKVVLKAMWIENDGSTDVTVAEVNVRILKADLACRAEYAIYRRADKTLELTGAPVAYKKGDEYRASRIVVNTDTEEISLEGAVQGTIKQADESKPASGDATPSGSSPAGTTGATAPGGTPPAGTAPTGNAPAGNSPGEDKTGAKPAPQDAPASGTTGSGTP